MAEFINVEKNKLERLFQMRSGYVLNFSNRTFESFVYEQTGKDIYSEYYSFKGESKANRLRAFWEKESGYIVGKLIYALIEYWRDEKNSMNEDINENEEILFNECIKIAQRLNQDSLAISVDAIQVDENDKDFSLLAKIIRENIEKNEPEVALDRLHTYMIKFVRKLCDKHNISYDKGEPLHSYYGKYIKFLKQNNFIESNMTEKILKYSITVLDEFNYVRNNKSFAHDNSILNYNESMLIFNNLSSLIAFVNSIELSLVE